MHCNLCVSSLFERRSGVSKSDVVVTASTYMLKGVSMELLVTLMTRC